MIIKKSILKIVNLFLRHFGAQIVRNTQSEFKMASAVQRITKHGIAINSIIDIGASNGKWSVEIMKIFPKAFFLAVEPLIERKRKLEKVKRTYSNFDYVLCVAGKEDGQEVTLAVSDDLDGSTVGGVSKNFRKIPARTIDSIIAEKKLKGPFLLKLDTHGYEVPILSGARNTLLETNVVIMEVYNFKISEHTMRFHEMCLYMGQLGFRCYDMADPMLRVYDRAFWQMDLFFCRDNLKIFSHLQYR